VFREIGAESYPLNLNQVMLAEEVRDGKSVSTLAAIDTIPSLMAATIEGIDLWSNSHP
jgi:hypothetical protein